MDKELQYMSINVGGMYAIVSPLRDKWKDIGLKVGLFPATLETIDKSNNGRTDQCLYSVLTKWLQRRDDTWKKGGTTWNVLIQALKYVGADDDVLAACKAEAITPDQTIYTESKENVTTEMSVKKKVEESAKPKLKDLVRLEVAPEWYTLGLQLDLTENMLNIIEKDVGHDVSTCKRKMFSKWLSTNKDASYVVLVDALVAIDKKDVAEYVSQKFLGKSIYDV